MKKLFQKFSPVFFAVVLLTIGISMLYLGGCSTEKGNPINPKGDNSSQVFDMSNPAIAATVAVQSKYTDQLMEYADVVGVGTSVDDNGVPYIIVYTAKDENSKSNNQTLAPAGLPTKLDNVPVVVVNSGKFVAFTLSGKYNPVPNGVSIINPREGCAAGTLSCIVQDGAGIKYILSNNHVMANENNAVVGDNIDQPGTYDSKPQCNTSYPNVVANLTAWYPIVFSTSANNTIDAAIAQLTSNTAISFTYATPKGYYGYPNTTTVSPSVRLKIQKVGRTTSLTTGTIASINTTVNVGYGSGTARFIGQIVTSSKFCQAGDSGSLVVTNNSSANPVGLLFAGTNNGTTIVNPINSVLSYFGVSIYHP
ncbi:MAG: hypothetical protein ABSG15_07235 [FCB group bacterium]|jgi:hypothetical protein